MADVLFIQAVRAYAAQHACATSWLRGLSNARVGKALALLHDRYAEPWTLDSLAHEVGTSRTALAVRFKELVGEAPMAYLTRWRVTRAANRMRSERINLHGWPKVWATTPTRCFQKRFGVSPGNRLGVIAMPLVRLAASTRNRAPSPERWDLVDRTSASACLRSA